jgi:hypothetical protein
MMDVEMPDGTIIEDVPEGVTKAQLLRRYGNYSGPKMAEMSSVPDDFQINESEEFQAQDDPGILSRLFNPPGGIGEAGPPPLTPEEGKSALGMTAATLGSIAFPPAAVPAAISRIPAAGGALSFLTKNLPKAFGSGAGGAGGETAADVVQGNEIDPKQALQTAREYGAAELGGELVSKVASKVLAPAKNAITDQAKKLLKFAQKENIPITAGALVPGMTEKIVQGGADNFIPSRLVNNHYREKMITRMNELMNEIPQNVGNVLGKEESSLITTEAFRAASNAKQAMAKKLRTDFLETIGAETPIKVKSTEALLNKILPQVKDNELRNFIEIELAQINKGVKSADSLETSLGQISAVKARGTDKKYLTQIREAIKDDFKSAGADMEKLSHSGNFFSMNSDLLASRSAKRLMNENLTSQQMTAEIFKSGNENFVKQLAKELPKETWDSLRAQNLANQLENFSTQSNKISGVRVLDKGDQLVKWIENNRPILREAYDPQTIEAFENFAQLAKASKGEVSAFNKDLAALGNANLAFGAGAAYLDAGTLMISTPVMMGVAKSMMNPDGLVKQWLTTGLKGAKTAGEAAKLGGRAVAGEDDSN